MYLHLLPFPPLVLPLGLEYHQEEQPVLRWAGCADLLLLVVPLVSVMLWRVLVKVSLAQQHRGCG